MSKVRTTMIESCYACQQLRAVGEGTVVTALKQLPNKVLALTVYDKH